MTEFLPPKTAVAVRAVPVERLRHCWVTADEHGRVPALLLEWRETPDGWQGRVVRPVLDMEDGSGGLARNGCPQRTSLRQNDPRDGTTHPCQ